MRLNGEQMEALVSALSNHFTPAELRRLTRFKLNEDYDDLVPEGARKQDAAFEIVQFAERRGKVVELFQGARGLNPSAPELERVLELAGASALRPEDQSRVRGLVLERIVSQRSLFQDPSEFRQRLSRIDTWVCRIEVPGGGGTGLLVGPDLVLTNWHVMEPVHLGEVSRDDVAFRFDFRAPPGGSPMLAEARCALAPEWDMDHSPPSEQDFIANGAEPKGGELDYALVRLDRAFGEAPVATEDPQAPIRDWFHARANPPALVKGDPLFVLQYPANLRLQLALGSVLSISPGGTRVRHNARTLGGSSGSPCFDANLELVALHHAGDPDFSPNHQPGYNQAIPIGRILELMRQRKAPAIAA